jgi:iron complex outermembrane receptor protein
LPAQAADEENSATDASDIIVRGGRPEAPVSAGKTDVPLQDTPQAISVVSADLLKKRGVTRLADALFSVAGVSRGSTYGFYDGYTIRGFDAAYGSVYLDGLINEAGGGGSNNELAGLESIEVVKGPASSLFGGGPLGGIINLVSKLPKAETFVNMSLSTGSYNLIEGMIDANAALDANGTLTARLVALYRDSDSFVRFAGYNRIYLQPAISWQIGPDTRFTAIGTYKRDHDNPFSPLNAWGTVFPNVNGRTSIHFSVNEGGDEKPLQYETRKTIGYMFDHGFSEKLKFSQTLRYLNRKTFWDRWMFAGDYLDEQLDGDGVPIAGTGTTIGRLYYGPYRETFKSFLVDNQLTLKLDTGPLKHNLLGGLDYRKTTSRYSGDGDFDQTHFPLNIFDPDYSLPLNPAAAPYAGYDTGRQMGFYIQDHIELGERVTVTLNGRWDRGVSNGELSTAFSPRFGATWEIVDGVTLYGNYAKSFTPQFGSQIVEEVGENGEPSVISQAPPERGRNIEMGAKFALPAAHLTGMISAYKLKRRNVLMTDPNFPDFSRLSGQQKSKGIEIEAAWQATPAFSLNLAYSYIRAKYVEADNTPPGTPLPNIPKHNLTLYGRYEVPEGPLRGLGGNLGFLYNSNRYVYDAYAYAYQDPMMVLKDYILLNGGLSYSVGTWEAQVTVNNLLDKRFFPDACCNQRVTPGEPRNWRLTLSRSF